MRRFLTDICDVLDITLLHDTVKQGTICRSERRRLLSRTLVYSQSCFMARVITGVPLLLVWAFMDSSTVNVRKKRRLASTFRAESMVI